MRILVTGGAGYIGSHTCLSLLEAGYDVTVIDNFCNSSPVALARVQDLTGRPIRLVEGDVRSPACLKHAFSGGVDAVIHFAALKAVGESCQIPLRYFENNVGGSIALMQAMEDAGVTRLVFSSSATVYGQPDQVPVQEDAALRVTNPYGRSKLVIEQMMQDWCASNDQLGAVMLRYFNPVGAHPSGHIGEDPRGEPNNLLPYVSQVAVGRRDCLRVFGSDYPTPDGTGIRDYIHVIDLARAHVKGLEYCEKNTGCSAFNLGSGRGYSVLEVVRAFEAASGRVIPLEFKGRRPGDVAELWADPTRAEKLLDWSAQRDLDAICRDVWNWQFRNPNGFGI